MAKSESIQRRNSGPFVFALLATAAYYGMLLYGPLKDSPLTKYTAEHGTEYAITFLFLWWMADLARITWSVWREKEALRVSPLPVRSGPESPDDAVKLVEAVHAAGPRFCDTMYGRRLLAGLSFVLERRSAEGLDEQLRTLEDKDADHVHSAYALGRFVVCVSPILGFLGTVVHYGGALNGLNPDDIADKLPAVTASMGTAFDTTAAALTVTMVAILSLFSMERVHQGVLREIDDQTERVLGGRFHIPDPRLTPFLDALQSAAGKAFELLQAVIQRQTESTNASVQAIHQHYEALRQSQGAAWQSALEAQSKQLSAAEASRTERFQEVLSAFAAERRAQLDGASQVAQKFEVLDRRTTQVIDRLADVLSTQGPLTALQEQMTNSLIVLQNTQKIDEAVHSLAAAVHLLTARHTLTNRPNAA